jgi:hypothetical protein
MPSSGKLRLVRRLRTLRRRQLRPRLRRLDAHLADLWSAPARQSVARQLGRLAEAVDASMEAARRMTVAEDRLAREVGRLAELPRSPRYGAGSGGGYGAGYGVGYGGGHGAGYGGGSGAAPSVRPGSLPTGLFLMVVALALAAGNAWLLDRHLLPPVVAADVVAFGPIPHLSLSVAFSALAVALGLAHFALFTAGRSGVLRVLGLVAIFLLVAQGGLQAGAAAVAAQAWAGAVTGSWAGMGALVLLAGAAGLVPPIIGATAHAAADRVARWSAAREHRAALRSRKAADQLVGRVERSMSELSAGMAELRAQADAIPHGDPARLLVRPDPATSVERLSGVLRRLADSAERDPGFDTGEAAGTRLRSLADLGALAIWVLAAGAALAIAASAAGAALETGLPRLVAGGMMAGVVTVLVGGLVLRLLLDRPGRRPDSRVVGAAILLLGVAAASLAMGLGAFAAAGPLFGGDPLGAAAILNLLALAAALVSARLPEGIVSAANALRLVASGTAWSALTVADAVLGAVDRVLVGGRRRGRRPDPAQPRPAKAKATPALGGIGAGHDRG